jgi:hypothetical protein
LRLHVLFPTILIACLVTASSASASDTASSANASDAASSANASDTASSANASDKDRIDAYMKTRMARAHIPGGRGRRGA